MSTPINPDYPIQSVGSVDDLMDIAVAMEGEAARRYEQLARRTEGHGQPEMVALFRQLAQLERDHERGLEAWARREGRRAPLASEFAWRLPETFGDEADDRPLAPYQALVIAVRNEERAFVFYTYLSALCWGNEELRSRAESLAREELKHVAMLRGLRRQAFHARETVSNRPPVHNLADLRRHAAGLESGSAEVDRLAARALAGHPAAAVLTRRWDKARPSADGTTLPASDTVEAARRAGVLNDGTLTADGSLALALRDAQEVLEAYLGIADHATDPAVLDEAQRLAESSLARLTLIRAQMADLRQRPARDRKPG